MCAGHESDHVSSTIVQGVTKNTLNLGSCSFVKHGSMFIIFGTHNQLTVEHGDQSMISLCVHFYYLICSQNAATEMLQFICHSVNNGSVQKEDTVLIYFVDITLGS